MSSITQQLDQLPSLDRTELLALWQKSFGRQASPGLRRELMLPILAFKIQELAHGGLNPELRKRLEEIRSSQTPKAHNDARRRFKLGTRLVREWKGKVHEVTIKAEGFEYQGKVYKNLSPIACHITGTHWSGPAFFGTKAKK
jgi:hypothetical protein